MPKRKAEKIRTSGKKSQKSEVHSAAKRRRRIISSSDSSVSENNSDIEVENVTVPSPLALSEAENVENVENAPIDECLLDIVNAPEVHEEAPTALDAEILCALGSSTDDVSEFGEKIHENLAQLWLPILKKGLQKEDKEKLLKENLIPQNCNLLQAPKLNAEISAAVTESTRLRDKKIVGSQQQLGAGVTAVNRAMDLLLNKEFDKLKVIKHLSDACRILSDLHHRDTQVRVKLITPSLDKSFLNVIQDNCRDDTLFGNKLSEKIKASKAIEKQGLQIKKTFNPPGPSTSVPFRAPQPRGNWGAPPRYPSYRGGRGGIRRPGPVGGARRPPVAPAQAKYPPKQQTRPQTQQ